MKPMLRRFWDADTGACSYLLDSESSRQAVFIDPVSRHVPLYLGVLAELGHGLACVLETHLHADHVSAAAALRDVTGCAIGCGRHSGIAGADLLIEDGDSLRFGEIVLAALSTPGHTADCLTFRWGDHLFTGDALLVGGCGRTDEPGANPGRLFDSLCRRLLSLPDEFIVFPGHGSQARWLSCIGEERRTNPLLRGTSRDEFIAACRQRQEAPIAAMAQFLAANRRCGSLNSPIHP